VEPEVLAELGLPSSLSTWLLLAALPLLLAACTAFTKVSIVLAALRQGLGAQRLLPMGSMLALALVITALIMAPVGTAVALKLEALGAFQRPEALGLSDWLSALDPLWRFAGEQARSEEVERFAGLTGRALSDPLTVVPAFLVSELGRGLEIAVMILLPFVVVDLIAAESMLLLGLQQTPTAVISLPAKILLFLAADGWRLMIVGLVEGYR